MSFTITTRETATANGISIDASRSFEGEQQAAIETAIAASTTDQQIPVSIDISEVVLVAFVSTVDMTIETNDGAAPTDTLNLTAGIPRIWREGDYESLFLTGDVTDIFVTNGGLTEGTLKVIVLTDLP